MSENGGLSSLPTVSVVVPTYNRKEFLPNLLPPLLDDPAATEIIVVVDGCRDGSYELLQQLAEGSDRLKPLFIENSGQTAAQEAGLALATGDVVVLIDDDVVPGPGLITGHARHHALEDDIVVIGYMPTTVPAKATPSTFITVLYADEYERATQVYLDDPDQILRGLWMGNMSLRAADCRRIGLFNPDYASLAELYHVDRDFGLRCLKAGLRGVHDRSLRGEHVLVRSLPSFLRNSRAQGAGIVGLHEIHGDVIGPFSPDSLTEDLPVGARSLVRVSRHPLVRRPLLLVATGWIRVAGAFGLTRLQLPAAKLARKIEMQHGALEALDRTT